MDWLKEDYIEQEAEKGPTPALLCSIEHHEQIQAATWEELAEIGSDIMRAWYCALCCRFGGGKESMCPLYDGMLYLDCGDCKCCPEWRTAKRAWPYSPKDLPAFKEAHQKLLDRLYHERDKLMKQINIKATDENGNEIPLCEISEETLLNLRRQTEKKEPEPLRHLDYGLSHDGYLRIAVKRSNGVMHYANELYEWETLRAENTEGTLTEPGAIILGNLAEELIEIAQDLERFEIPDVHHDIGVALCDRGIHLRVGLTGRIMPLETAKEFSLKFRRLICTQEKKQAMSKTGAPK